MSRREEILQLRQAALEGASQAQFDLACAYSDGNGVPKNPRTAFRWFLKAAEGGEAEAMTAVGYCFLNGEGIDQDEDQAVAWLRKAKQAGSSDADRYLIGCRIYGQGMEQDLQGGLEEAERLFSITGDQEFAYLLACAYADLIKNDDQALAWHTKAAELGHDESMVWLGYFHRFGIGVNRDLKQAFHWYQRAAEAGNDAGMENLAVCYQHGEGVAQDLEAAYGYRLQAANLGHAVSKRWLGKHLIHGAGVDADPIRGIVMLEELALEDPAACMMLGEVYYYGEGVEADVEQATRWFEKAAAAEWAEAFTFLGTMAWYGEGVPKDHDRAEGLYRRAAELGEPQALYNLAYLLDERGDFEAAHGCLEQAAKAGHGPSACVLAQRCLEEDPNNAQVALDYLEPAVAEEDPDALYLRAEYMRDGVGGPPNLQGAMELFHLAQIQGRDTRVERGVLRRRMRGMS